MSHAFFGGAGGGVNKKSGSDRGLQTSLLSIKLACIIMTSRRELGGGRDGGCNWVQVKVKAQSVHY